MFCALILLPYVKNSIYSMADNNSTVSSENSDPDTELPEFSVLKLFDMKPKEKKVSNKNYTQY